MGDAWHRAKVQSPPSASLVCRASCRASSARNFGPAELASPLGKIEDARRRNRLKCHNNPAVTSASPELRRLRNFPRDFLSLATPRPFPVPLVPSAILILRKPIRSSRKKKTLPRPRHPDEFRRKRFPRFCKGRSGCLRASRSWLRNAAARHSSVKRAPRAGYLISSQNFWSHISLLRGGELAQLDVRAPKLA